MELKSPPALKAVLVVTDDLNFPADADGTREIFIYPPAYLMRDFSEGTVMSFYGKGGDPVIVAYNSGYDDRFPEMVSIAVRATIISIEKSDILSDQYNQMVIILKYKIDAGDY